MFTLEAAHAAVTWYLVGLVWLVQRVHYPMLARIDHRQFIDAHARHVSAIGPVVAPPMLAEFALALWLAWQPTTRGWASATALGVLAAIWATTFFVMIPLHGRLGNGFDERLHSRLVRWNWFRTIGWSLRGLLALTCLGTYSR